MTSPKTPRDELVQAEIDRDRWSEGADHHPTSLALMKFISDVDFEAYGDHFCWKFGSDGDNGETLMYQMDAFFEAKDRGDL